MPTAKAKIGDVLLAETDVWENVEGNVYVREELPLIIDLQLIFHEPSSHQQLSKTSQHLWEPIRPPSVLGRAMRNTIRSNLGVSDSVASMPQVLMTLSDKESKDAAWYYPEPYEKAMNIKDHVAFCEFILLTFLQMATDYPSDKTKVQVTVE